MQDKIKFSKRRSRLLAISLILNGVFLVLLSSFFFVRQAREFRQRVFYTIFPSYQATIVMDGNSLTQMGYWEILLSRTDVVNSGKGGFTSSHFLNSLKSDVINHNPKICFMEGGGNDFSVGVPLLRSISNFQRIVDSLKKYNIIPVLQSTIYSETDTLNNKKVDSLNLFLSDLSIKEKIEYIDLNAILAKDRFLKSEFTTDGTHLNSKAYLLWAQKIKEVLQKHNL